MRISDWSSDVCSSDLNSGCGVPLLPRPHPPAGNKTIDESRCSGPLRSPDRRGGQKYRGRGYCRHRRRWRSEEHTSELPSLMRISYVVLWSKTTLNEISLLLLTIV